MEESEPKSDNEVDRTRKRKRDRLMEKEGFTNKYIERYFVYNFVLIT